ncbi:helix-turn-helix transcriptional regulator [Piscirickettsia litoralis]
MNLSSRTIEYHMTNIREKLNAKSKIELMSIYSLIRHAGMEYILINK